MKTTDARPYHEILRAGSHEFSDFCMCVCGVKKTDNVLLAKDCLHCTPLVNIPQHAFHAWKSSQK